MREISNIESSDKNEKQDDGSVLNLTKEWFEFVLEHKDNKDGKTVETLEKNFNVSIPSEGQEPLAMTVEIDNWQNKYVIIKDSEGILVIKPLKEVYNSEDGFPAFDLENK